MTAESTGTFARLFPWNPAGFNPTAGLKLFVFALVAGSITVFTDTALVVFIIGALLTWLTDIPGTLANRLIGFGVYAVSAAVLVWVATEVLTEIGTFTAGMFVVGLLFTLPMALSSRGFMVGWASIITFIQANNMTGSGEPGTTIIQLAAGAAFIAALTIIWPRGTGPWGSTGAEPPPESGGNNDRTFVLVYALTVAAVLAVAASIGMNQFTFGVQMAATSAFMVLGPTTQQNWVSAVGRAVAVIAGISLGLLLVSSIDSLSVLTFVWAIFPALAVATLGVSYAFAIGAYTTQMMMTIVILGGDYEAFAVDSNNRIVAEAIGIGLAVLATLFLQWWIGRRQVRDFAQPELESADLAAR